MKNNNKTEKRNLNTDNEEIKLIDYCLKYHSECIDGLNERRRELINRMGTNKK